MICWTCIITNNCTNTLLCIYIHVHIMHRCDCATLLFADTGATKSWSCPYLLTRRSELKQRRAAGWWEFTSSRACAALKPGWRDRKFTCNLRPGGTNYCGTAEHRACTKACSKLTLAHSSQDEVPSRLHFISLSGFRFLSKKKKERKRRQHVNHAESVPVGRSFGPQLQNKGNSWLPPMGTSDTFLHLCCWEEAALWELCSTVGNVCFFFPPLHCCFCVSMIFSHF